MSAGGAQPMAWLERVALWAYGCVMWIARPLLRAKLRGRAAAEPLYAQAMDERFGIYDGPPTTGGFIWIHAVSYGEVLAASELIAYFRRQIWTNGDKPSLLLTHGTATGRAQGAQLLLPGDAQAWLPWDDAQAVARFLAHYRPRVGVLMETEVWPQLLHQAQALGLPMVLANARMSEKTAAQSRRLSWLARPAFASLSMVLAQSDADAQRLRATGVAAPRCTVLGNVKFDVTPPAEQLELGLRWRDASPLPVVVLAVSREGEEQQFLEAFSRIVEQTRSSKASSGEPAAWPFQPIIVPRHPQRFDAVAQLAQAMGFAVSRRSQWEDAAPSGSPALWLGDSMGEMPAYYALARVALLGGSFEPLGGQNLIQAAACGCPLICGPSTFNFAPAAQGAVQAGAAQRAGDMTQALAQALAWLANPPQLSQASGDALAFAQAHRGATQATWAAVLRLCAA